MNSRKSFARSVSSFSLYSHFAGERFSHPNRHHYHSSSRKNSAKSSDVEDVSVKGASTDSNYSNGSSIDEKDGETSAPKASVGKAMFMFLKAFIGSGVLFLPKAFEHGGLALSCVLMVIIAGICLFAFLRLVKTQLVVGGSYGDMGQVLYGRWIKYIVLFFIVISQMGFVCSYFVFISGNLVNIVDVLSHCGAQIEQKYYIWFPLIFIMPLVLIRHIAKLSFTAIIADAFILFGLISCLYFTAHELKNFGMGPEVKAINPANFALMLGTATFSFEGIGLVIPIVESMKQPERFPFVVTVGMAIVCSIYILIGAISYMAYGNHIQAAVVYNFPRDNPLTIAVQLLYSIAIILTAPLMLFPAIKILESALFRKCRSGSDDLKIKWSKNLFRIFLLCFCAAVAFGIGGENLDIFVSLVGSVACVPLCFIFPGLFHFKVCRRLKDKLFDAALSTFGVGIMVFTLYVTIASFLKPESGSFVLPPYCPT
ncbi:transmembrane amino acid transporter protein-domain-containing protein [Parasitella parasitica]|nr:transmembrane amino acid transporter protein-domain-containing protein [Parasitella parasitica]